MITIYRQTENGRIGVFTTPINEGCKASGKLGESQTMNLKFSVEKPIGFKIGDYVDLSTLEAGEYDGEYYDYRIPSFVKMKYAIKDNQYPTYNQTTGGYDYDLKLFSFYEAWGNMVYKFTIGISGKETKWSYTGTIREHLAIFLENIKANKDNHLFGDFLKEQAARVLKKNPEYVTEEDFKYLNEYNVFYIEDGKQDLSGMVSGNTPSYIEDRHVFLSFDGTKMNEVFKTLCSEENFDCDFWYDPVKKILCFGRCESGEIVELDSTSEEPECAITTSGASGEYANRLICYGSEKNLTARYRRDLTFRIDKTFPILNFSEDVYPVSGFKYIDYCACFMDSVSPLDIKMFKRGKRQQISSVEMMRDEKKLNGESFTRAEDSYLVLTSTVGMFTLAKGNYNINTYAGKAIDLAVNTFLDVELQHPNQREEESFPINAYFVRISVTRHDKHGSNADERLELMLYYNVLEDAEKKKYINLQEIKQYTKLDNSKEIREDCREKGDNVLYLSFDPKKFPLKKELCKDALFESLLQFEGVEYEATMICSVEVGVITQGISAFKAYGNANMTASANIPETMLAAECDLIIDGVTYNDAIVINANNASSIEGKQRLWLKSEFSEIKDKIVNGTEFRIDDILFGKIPVSYFSKEKDGDVFVNSVLNRNLMLPETYYLLYTKSVENGYVEYGDIKYAIKPEDGWEEKGWKECHDTYIDVYDDISPSEYVEKTFVNDKIFPMMGDEAHNGKEVLDVGVHKIVKDEDTAYEIGRTHYQYAFNTTFKFTNDALLDGKDLRVRFTSGSMNGMEFDVQYYDVTKSGLDLEGREPLYNEINMYECFVIINNEDYGVELPNGVIYPNSRGEKDRFILIGFDPTALDDDEGMVAKAEERLLADAVKRANQIRNNTATYTATLYANENTDIDRFYIGKRVKVTDTATNTRRTSRVLGYDIFLDIPYDHPSFTIGQSAEYSRLRSIENYAGTKSDGKLN